MKLLIAIISVFVLSGCETVASWVISPALFPINDIPLNYNTSKIFLILDKGQCVFSAKIAPTRKIWKEGLPNLVTAEVDRLKAMAGRNGANSISNVIVKDPNNPIGEADAYICPEDVYLKNSDNQKDKVFFDKVVKVID